MRAGERELQAGGQRRVDVEVVVGGANDLVDLREHGGHALRRRRRCGQEAQRAVVLLLVRAVGDEAVQVNVEAEVGIDVDFEREFGREGEYGGAR